ncbi:hypothetical protein EYB26_005710 [Talaromyces marneffei]|uniref:uncharacterized protein n=1 Tax=Talaromyces marneffei TaxID=37727 RepID=UPI0012A88E64|nr:uncharacterized protein EYB26_005710 [Talaromyces marneffei]QGA18032.1 hypothetical protein EYB26_005710 [Talaromyces marneffei]
MVTASNTKKAVEFLDNTTAVILVGEVADVDNILAIALRFAGRDFIYIHHVSQETSYKSQRPDLGTFLRGNRMELIRFKNPQQAKEVYDFVTVNQVSSDEDG